MATIIDPSIIDPSPSHDGFISSLSKSLQSLCHGFMEFDSQVEIIGYIAVNIDSGHKVDYVLDERVQKSSRNSDSRTLDIKSNSFLAKNNINEQNSHDEICLPVSENPVEMLSLNRRISSSHQVPSIQQQCHTSGSCSRPTLVSRSPDSCYLSPRVEDPVRLKKRTNLSLEGDTIDPRSSHKKHLIGTEDSPDGGIVTSLKKRKTGGSSTTKDLSNENNCSSPAAGGHQDDSFTRLGIKIEVNYDQMDDINAESDSNDIFVDKTNMQEPEMSEKSASSNIKQNSNHTQTRDTHSYMKPSTKVTYMKHHEISRAECQLSRGQEVEGSSVTLGVDNDDEEILNVKTEDNHTSTQVQVLLTCTRIEAALAEQAGILRGIAHSQAVKEVFGDSDLADLIPSPIQEEEDLEALLLNLQVEDFSKKLVHYLSRLSGSTVGETVRKVCRRMVGNSVWSLYSLKGTSNKRPLQSELLYTVITRVCMNVHENAKQSTIDEETASFLRQAPFHTGGLKYKAKPLTPNPNLNTNQNPSPKPKHKPNPKPNPLVVKTKDQNVDRKSSKPVDKVYDDGSMSAILDNLPVQDDETFTILMRHLGDSDFRHKLTSNLASLGSKSVSSTIRRMCQGLASNAVWSQYSLKGTSHKQAFNSEPLYDIIIGSCTNIHPEATHCNIVAWLADFLRYAPHKPGGAKYKKADQPARRSSTQGAPRGDGSLAHKTYI